MIINYIGLHVKWPLFLSYFNESLFFPMVFQKYTQISAFMKIRPMAAELFILMSRRRQTDRHDEANNCFTQFCERA
jgi:hypothetical protein